MKPELQRFLAAATAEGPAAARVVSLDELRARRGEPEKAARPWSLDAVRGRLVEISARGGGATLSAALDLVAEAQAQGEPVAWAMLADGTFYPPDAADNGIDLAALVVVRAPNPTAASRATERLVRSGAFGLVVIDLACGDPELSMQIQGRLVTLAQTHDAAIVLVTDKADDAASIGSLISLRVAALHEREDQRAGFALRVRALKDKHLGPSWDAADRRCGPDGYDTAGSALR